MLTLQPGLRWVWKPGTMREKVTLLKQKQGCSRALLRGSGWRRWAEIRPTSVCVQQPGPDGGSGCKSHQEETWGTLPEGRPCARPLRGGGAVSLTHLERLHSAGRGAGSGGRRAAFTQGWGGWSPPPGWLLWASTIVQGSPTTPLPTQLLPTILPTVESASGDPARGPLLKNFPERTGPAQC